MKCASCGTKSKLPLKQCSRCQSDIYCDAKCQKAHWKEHRNKCKDITTKRQVAQAETARILLQDPYQGTSYSLCMCINFDVFF
jgi:hypothetical protein